MNEPNDILRPLTTAWSGKIQEAVRHKKRFNDTAEQCMAFFNGAVGFMWEPGFLNKFIGGNIAPMFKITIAKAFELVALFGPTLYWRNPTRLVKPRQQLALTPELFAGLDPTGQLFQMAQQQNGQQHAIDDAVAQMLEMYLNYTPVEQPGGGLATHASQSITEALIKGRGVLWPRPYTMPSSDRILTGCFYDSVDNLLIDPDATSLHEAKWIAQRCVQPIWEIERQFGLPPDTLKGKGNMESGNEQGRQTTNEWSKSDRRIGKTFDLGTYYKVWSKGGVGARLGGAVNTNDQTMRSFDQVVGDYAYICIMPNVPFPLNAHTEVLRSATESELQKRFQWPAPYWLDDRWPCAVLDFYKAPNDPWAIAPMAPGLGELAYLNILLSQIANHIWWSCRTLIAGDSSLDPNVESQIRSGGDLSYLRLKLGGKKLSEVLDFIQAPTMNPDVWRIIEYVSAMFDKRVGLSELLYGANPGGVQMRSAEETATKKEMVSIRPDYMAGKVEDWMTEAADMEKLCCRWFVEAQDLTGMFGQVEQMIWSQYITNEPPENVVREMRATVAANSTRKPDKARDTANMGAILPVLLPIMDNYLQMTGNPEPLNGLLKTWGKTIDQPMDAMMLPPPQPPEGGDPEAEAAMQEQQMQMEMAQQQHMQKLQQTGQQHVQKMQIEASKAQQGMKLKEAAGKQAIQLKKQQAAAKPKPKARSAA